MVACNPSIAMLEGIVCLIRPPASSSNCRPRTVSLLWGSRWGIRATWLAEVLVPETPRANSAVGLLLVTASISRVLPCLLPFSLLRPGLRTTLYEPVPIFLTKLLPCFHRACFNLFHTLSRIVRALSHVVPRLLPRFPCIRRGEWCVLQESLPGAEVLQDIVFCGPEDGATSSAQREATVRHALRQEMQLQAKKPLLDRQAKHLLSTNYVSAEKAKHRTDLVEKLPETPAVPACFEARAKLIPENAAGSDVARAAGPSSATAAAQRELGAKEGENAEELVQWMSSLEEAQDDESELTSLPALQGVLVRMESQAGRVVANELTAIVEEGGCGALG